MPTIAIFFLRKLWISSVFKNDFLTVLKKITILGGVRFVSFFVPLVYISILTKAYGLEGYGTFVTLLSIAVILTQIVDYGFNVYLPKLVAQEYITNEIFVNVVVSKLIIACVCSFFLLVSTILFDIDIYSYLIIAIYLLIQSFNLSWLLQGQEKIAQLSLCIIVERMAFVACIFTLTLFNINEEYLLIASVISCIILVLLTFILSSRESFKLNFKLISFSTVINLYKDGWGYFYSRCAFTAYTNLNVIVLSLFTNNETVGLYSVAEKFYLAIKTMMGVVTTTLYPYMCRTKNIQVFRSVAGAFLLLSVLAYLFSNIYIYDIFNFLVTSDKLNEIVSIYQYLILAVFIAIPSMFLGYPLLGAYGYQLEVNRTSLYTFVIYGIAISFCSLLNDINVTLLISIIIMCELYCLLSRSYFVLKHKIPLFKLIIAGD